ncbi:rhomboid family intramembrane serine protease [Desulfuromonas sp. KJ2020]|uniref:rhomboid family intramembrane serine protease n=1 Tax=Desulfuromonas sp. KJ2020 TaxID=2919173 RepID=UPI0020A7E61C|nr:rhomboid family intramembrane serine protease [Desulfuromonas sp. KJ2020]MCP3177011.1 rhomboid family intramembrane serine protease [Desulfuromonas sp. KJ2020]
MDWKRFFDRLGMNGTRWQWRMMRWERQLKGVAQGQIPASEFVSLTKVLIAVNLILFSLMAVHGTLLGQGMRAILSPSTQLLVHWGGQFWPLVINDGQWWRCLTYAFTHGGLIHLAFNMVVLYQIGGLIEAEIGLGRTLTLYTVTALTATLAGYYWHPMVPVVGASGSLFGLIGFAVVYYHRMGGPQGIHIRNFMFRWAVFAFIFGLMVGADNAGHLGGAAGGALIGLFLPVGIRARRTLAPLFNGLALASAAAIVISLALLAVSILRN